MNKQEFYIYEIGKKDYRIIFSSWLNVRNKEESWYPPYKNKAGIEKCLFDSTKPDPFTWKKINLNKKIVTTSNFTEAKKYLGVIKGMTDVKSESDDEKMESSRHMRQKRKLSTESESTDSESESEIQRPSKKLKPILKWLKEKSNAHQNRKLRMENNLDPEMPIMDSFANLFEFNNLIMHKLDQSLIGLKQVESRLKSIEEQVLSYSVKQVVNKRDIVDDVLDFLPLETMENFDSFETKLDEQNFFHITARYMKSVGGETIHDLVRQIMDRFIGDGLAILFNVDGKAIVRKNSEGEVLQPKQSFAKTKLYKCIMKAAFMKNNDEVDEKKLRTRTIGPWLAGARQRLERESNKKQKDATSF